MGMSQPPHFLQAKLSSFVGSSIEWDTMVINQALCESHDGSGSGIASIKSKSLFRICIYSCKNSEHPHL